MKLYRSYKCEKCGIRIPKDKLIYFIHNINLYTCVKCYRIYKLMLKGLTRKQALIHIKLFD